MGKLVGGAVLQYSINNISKRTQIANTTEGGLPLLNIGEMRKNLKP